MARTHGRIMAAIWSDGDFIAMRGSIDLTSTDYHLYLGPGWVHGGGREYAPVHHSCCGESVA